MQGTIQAQLADSRNSEGFTQRRGAHLFAGPDQMECDLLRMVLPGALICLRVRALRHHGPDQSGGGGAPVGALDGGLRGSIN